ncbi:MAG TPA: hypothetical protein VFF73_41060 [Planctomycetota bacterium]|nr:hypothetical protein [Planctomycetota bacterium]
MKRWHDVREELRAAGADRVLAALEDSTCPTCGERPEAIRSSFMRCACGAEDVAGFVARLSAEVHGDGHHSALIEDGLRLLERIRS